MVYPVRDGGPGLETALQQLFTDVDKAIDEGINIIILSDRMMDRDNAAIPALLASAGLHHHLIRRGTRTKVGLILESGEPREVHHFAPDCRPAAAVPGDQRDCQGDGQIHRRAGCRSGHGLSGLHVI